jgi:cysteine desulfurase/selenocysteine lyase
MNSAEQKNMGQHAMTQPDWALLRAGFPIFEKTMNGKRLCFLDSASSAQKPQAVMVAMSDAMTSTYANIHRGLYNFSQEMTQRYELVRGKVQAFLNARSEKEIVFTRNTTEAINLFAHGWGKLNLNEGDNIILTRMEHHANIVPWQMLSTERGFEIRIIELNKEDGTLKLDMLEDLMDERTQLVTFVQTSNVLGTVNPAKEMIARVKKYNADIITMVDASQSAVHMPIDVQDLGCDALCFTGHKLYGPTGAGVLYGRAELLEGMQPFQGGGDMITRVSFEEGTTFQHPPQRFEAGTASFIDVIGLGAAIDYVSAIGMQAIHEREAAIFEQLTRELLDIGGVTIYGTQSGKAPVLSFTMDWAHAADVNMILDQCGVCVRTGQHCAEPLADALGVEVTLRASLGLYTDEADIDQFIQSMKKAKMMLS